MAKERERERERIQKEKEREITVVPAVTQPTKSAPFRAVPAIAGSSRVPNMADPFQTSMVHDIASLKLGLHR